MARISHPQPFLKMERFSVNTSMIIAMQLRQAAQRDRISISQYIECALLETLHKHRCFDQQGLLQPTIGQKKNE